MHNLILISSIFGANTFFVISALIGLQYNSQEDNYVYILYNIIIMGVSLLIFARDALLKKRKLKVYMLTIPFLIIGIFLTTYLLLGVSEFAKNFFIYFLVWSLPAFFVGIYYSWNSRYKKILKSLDIIMILGSVASIISSILHVLQGTYSAGIGGTTNQTLSYITAFVFGLNLFLNFTSFEIQRFKFFRSYFYQIISIVLLPMQVLGVVIAGGRGGMVLLIVYLILFVFSMINRKRKIKLTKLFVSFIFAFLIFLAFGQNEIVISGFERGFSYVGDESINWQGTPNRDIVYLEALELIKARPIFGYGLFGYLSYTDNPHNIFLEILLEGGIVYFIFFFSILTILTLKYLRLQKDNPDFLLIGLIGLFPIIMLLFSGTYLVSAELWFFLGIILSIEHNFQRNKKTRKVS